MYKMKKSIREKNSLLVLSKIINRPELLEQIPELISPLNHYLSMTIYR